MPARLLLMGTILRQGSRRVHGTFVLCQPHIPPGKAGFFGAPAFCVLCLQGGPVKGQEYYQRVEGRRENGKVKQRVLCHLGQYPTVDVALERIPFLIKIAPRGGFSRKAVLSGNQYTPQTHDHLLEYDHEKRWMNREATTGFLQDKLTLLRAIREQGKA